MENSNKDYSSSNESSDDDYSPEEIKDLSEEDSDDPCDDISEKTPTSQKRSKFIKEKKAKRQKIDNVEISQVSKIEENYVTEEKDVSVEEQKKKADSLWADFLSDTGSKPKPKNDSQKNKSDMVDKIKKKEIVKVTKIFDFAGEQVKVTKEVPADSVEARLADLQNDKLSTTSTSAGTKSITLPEQKAGIKMLPKKSGMQSILGQINKKNTISTLEKSKLDWAGYKKNEGLEEEIQNHNKGKNGYLEKQDFLQRADLRQFEIEKQLRTSRRSNR